MTTQERSYESSLYALAVIGLFICFSSPATSKDLFSLEDSAWKSSETFEANMARQLGVEEKRSTEQKQQAVPKKPVVLHPVSLPALATPKENKEESATVHVSSTEDVRDKQELSDTLETQPLSFSEKQWRTLSEPPGYMDNNIASSYAGNGEPLHVRMSYLPKLNIAPPPKPDRESAAKKGHDQYRQALEDANRKPPPPTQEENVAACAALQAYKQKQLDAIESDRQTLAALKEAIRTLGLSKQLNFLTEKGSALTLSDATGQPPDTGGQTLIK